MQVVNILMKKITVNHRDFNTYFPLEWQRKTILEPFKVTQTEGQFDLVVNVQGGGLTGQAGAIPSRCERQECLRAILEWLSVKSMASLKHGNSTSSPNDKFYLFITHTAGYAVGWSGDLAVLHK